MGIILLSLAIFPMLGIGSFHLFKAEIPGGTTVERMQPRLAETAKMLWKTYIVLTLFEIILLQVGGVARKVIEGQLQLPQEETNLT